MEKMFDEKIRGKKSCLTRLIMCMELFQFPIGLDKEMKRWTCIVKILLSSFFLLGLWSSHVIHTKPLPINIFFGRRIVLIWHLAGLLMSAWQPPRIMGVAPDVLENWVVKLFHPTRQTLTDFPQQVTYNKWDCTLPITPRSTPIRWETRKSFKLTQSEKDTGEKQILIPQLVKNKGRGKKWYKFNASCLHLFSHTFFRQI
jgi:hypothetical protein